MTEPATPAAKPPEPPALSQWTDWRAWLALLGAVASIATSILAQAGVAMTLLVALAALSVAGNMVWLSARIRETDRKLIAALVREAECNRKLAAEIELREDLELVTFGFYLEARRTGRWEMVRYVETLMGEQKIEQLYDRLPPTIARDGTALELEVAIRRRQEDDPTERLPGKKRRRRKDDPRLR